MMCRVMWVLRRRRLLWAGRVGRYGNQGRRCGRAQRRKRASDVYPNRAWITAKVTNSASDSFGTIPTLELLV